MSKFEDVCMAIRYDSKLKHLNGLWKALNPIYVGVIGWSRRDMFDVVSGRKSVLRNFNGTDPVRIVPNYRAYGHSYEPEVWNHLMSRVRQGDVIADVGAFIGLYTMALARRVGADGRVFSFEPTPRSFALLKRHARLNHVSRRVRLHQAAVGAHAGQGVLMSHPDPRRTHIDAPTDAPGTSPQETSTTVGDAVQVVTLDDVFANHKLDIVKIDVEGHEEAVLRGATNVFQREDKPRLIYVEVHPYAWPELGTTSESLLSLLREAGYRVTLVDGQPVSHIDALGEIIAERVRKFTSTP